MLNAYDDASSRGRNLRVHKKSASPIAWMDVHHHAPSDQTCLPDQALNVPAHLRWALLPLPLLGPAIFTLPVARLVTLLIAQLVLSTVLSAAPYTK